MSVVITGLDLLEVSVPVGFNHRSRKLPIDEKYIFQVAIRSSLVSTNREVERSYHAKLDEPICVVRNSSSAGLTRYSESLERYQNKRTEAS